MHAVKSPRNCKPTLVSQQGRQMENEETCMEIVVNEDDMSYACEVQQTHSESNGNTVTDTSKDVHSNS